MNLKALQEKAEAEFDAKFVYKLPANVVAGCLCGKHKIGELLVGEVEDARTFFRQHTLSILEAVKEEIKGMKVTEHKIGHFGQFEAETFEEKDFANAVLDTLLTKLEESK